VAIIGIWGQYTFFPLYSQLIQQQIIKQTIQTWYIRETHDTLFILGLPTPQWWKHPQWSQVSSGYFTIFHDTVVCWDLDI